MKQVSFRIPDSLVQEVDEQLRISNYSNRSDLLRSLLRKWLDERKMKRGVT